MTGAVTVHGVSLDAWCERYGITPTEHPCECGRLRRSTVPIAKGRLRGLQSPPCECGTESVAPWRVISVDGECLTGIARELAR